MRCTMCHVSASEVLWCRIRNCPVTPERFPTAEQATALKWKPEESHHVSTIERHMGNGSKRFYPKDEEQ